MPLSAGDPERIGDYALEDRLGSGGMGVVYLARSASGRQVAVKVVHQQFAENDEFRTRFRQEVAAARRVSGAFTAPVVDADPEAERPWMATLYVPGPTLSERLTDGGPLDAAELRRLALGLVEALSDIHRVGVVHRDLKPANVLIAPDGPRVIDFGISRAGDNQALTETGRVMGTPPFMSPEQLSRPREVTAASDVFSLGALLVYAATGGSPFDAESPYMTAYQVVYEPPSLEEVAEPLHGVVRRCLAKAPDDRPGLAELERLLDALPGSGPVRVNGGAQGGRRGRGGAERTWATTLNGFRRRRPVLAAVTGAAALALVGGTVALVNSPSGGVRTGGAAEEAGQPSRAERVIALPAGWRPWQLSLFEVAGDAGAEGAAVADDEVFGRCERVGTDLYCGGYGFSAVRVDGATGHVEWRTEDLSSDAEDSSIGSQPIGVRDGRVIVHDGPSDTPQVVGLDTETGRKKWSRRTSDNTDTAVFGHGVLVSDPGDRSLTAWKATTGERLWTMPVPRGQICSAVAYDEVPYALCSENVTGEGDHVRYSVLRLDPRDGTPKRLVRLKDVDNPLGVVGHELLIPRLGDDFGPTRYVSATLVDLRTGAIRRTAFPDNARGDATLLDDRVYFVQESGRVTAVDAKNGKQLWSEATTVERLGPPVLSERENTVYLASSSGRLLALDQRTGKERWQGAARSPSSGTGSAQVLRVRGAVAALAGDGTLFSVDPLRPDAKPAKPDGKPTRSATPRD
ncbi:PQQ-binding-like beta-propeller repeat protein [Streptomyces sp. NA02950]|uniref:protein kinase domain-containing protein n=1 Tax=Streptomyces sp. NA02950 TaxID=2742137 RepID=UPI001592ABDA|nr:PQQ-binding-like beta-propeller repeat protein [Streptomyces sp. NA02950]QKV93428.1 PQQ-binding-like beta-propeller repeat protein [Streptomyces sp. NA02950]